MYGDQSLSVPEGQGSWWPNDRGAGQYGENYVEALQIYYEAIRLEIDPYNRSHNIGHIYISSEEHTKTLEYYFRPLERNPFLPQAFNKMAVIYHYAQLSPL